MFFVDILITIIFLVHEEINTNNITKRRKINSTRKNVQNAENFAEENQELSRKSKSPKPLNESDACNLTTDSSKFEKIENSNISSNLTKFRKGSTLVANSPNTFRQKVSVDISNPAYREPFIYGWKRELVYRAGSFENQTKRMADIYYYTPEGKKVRSYREVIEFRK